MVQAWYQGGISVFDWTDPTHPRRSPISTAARVDSTGWSTGGTWSAYWYNGHIVSSEIARGLDILDLEPSALLSENEIDAAKSVHFDEFNTQGQPALVWPTTLRPGAGLRRPARAVEGPRGRSDQLRAVDARQCRKGERRRAARRAQPARHEVGR